MGHVITQMKLQLREVHVSLKCESLMDIDTVADVLRGLSSQRPGIHSDLSRATATLESSARYIAHNLAKR